METLIQGSEDDQKIVDVERHQCFKWTKVLLHLQYEMSWWSYIFFEKRSSVDTTKQLIISKEATMFKPDEIKITDTIGNVSLTSDSNVTKYNIVLETHKESGYTN